MSIYYVNPANNSGVAPFTTPENGAPTLHDLFTDLGRDFRDGDQVRVIGRRSYQVNESSFPTQILISYKTSFSIVGCDSGGTVLPDGSYASVIVDDESPLFNFYRCSNFSIKGITFKKAYPKKSVTMKMDSCYFGAMENCSFEFMSDSAWPSTDTSNPAVQVLLLNSNMMAIRNNLIAIPSNDSVSYENPNARGLYINGCVNTSIYNNIFDIGGKLNKPIHTLNSNGGMIAGNVFYNFGNPNNYGGTGTYYFPTVYSQGCDVFDIYSNVIDGISKGWCGIGVKNTQTYGKYHQHIRNNVIILKDEDGTCAVNTTGTDIVDIDIVNNIITSRTTNTKSCGFDVRLQYSDAIIDYNNFYNINRDMEIKNYSNPIWISACGLYTNRENPELLNFVSPSTYPANVYNNYMTSGTSNVRGAGMDGASPGLMSVDGTITKYHLTQDSVWINTNMLGLGLVYNKPNENAITFFNSTFTQTEAAVNSWYGFTKYDGVEGYYGNQFEFVCNYDSGHTSFRPPFGTYDRFYDKDISYVIANRKELWPFEGITCPPNPGRGYPTYENYETGLFGNPRADYTNECGELPCVIYDSVSDSRIIFDSTTETRILQNSAKPPCEG